MREEKTYCLAIDVEVDLRVVGWEDAVGGSDDWAGSHDVCCAVYKLCMCGCIYVLSGECGDFATRVE